MLTVVFQFGTGRKFDVTFVTADEATVDSHESPDIFTPRSCSAFPEKSMFFRHADGYCRAPNVFVGAVPNVADVNVLTMFVTSVNVCVGGCEPNAPPYPSWEFSAANRCVYGLVTVFTVCAVGWVNRSGLFPKLMTFDAAVELMITTSAVSPVPIWRTAFAVYAAGGAAESVICVAPTGRTPLVVEGFAGVDPIVDRSPKTLSRK